MENGLLHRRMSRTSSSRLSRVHEFTTQLAGTLELAPVGAARGRDARERGRRRRRASCWSIGLVSWCRSRLGREGADLDTAGWRRLPLETRAAGRLRRRCGSSRRPPRRRTTCCCTCSASPRSRSTRHSCTSEAREQARHDSLTGLLGHRAFQEMLEAQTAGKRRSASSLLDIDDFKEINDLYGHQTGDDALRARRAEALRDGMRAGRQGLPRRRRGVLRRAAGPRASTVRSASPSGCAAAWRRSSRRCP